MVLCFPVILISNEMDIEKPIKKEGAQPFEQPEIIKENKNVPAAERQSLKSYWEQGDNKNIAYELNESLGRGNDWNLGYGDYRFDIQRASRTLKLDEIINNNPEYQNILKETNDPNHFMTKLKAREILIRYLLPFVKTFSKVYYSTEESEYLTEKGSGKPYASAPENLRNLTGLLILATKGQGYKSFFLKEEDYKSASQMQTALETRPYRDFEQMCNSLRGEELSALVNTAFENDKRDLEKRYLEIQQQGDQKQLEAIRKKIQEI